MRESLISTCEACKQAPAQESIESYCPQHPFQLCNPCSHRLRAHTLRPLECFNLAASHTRFEYYLCDDFYREDGTACQPLETVVSPEDFPAPNLEQARQSPEGFLDYAISRWFLKEDAMQALQTLEKSLLVESLTRRVATSMNPNVEGRAYEICSALGPVADSWIRGRWQNYHPDTIRDLIKATAKCLPISEGFPLALEGLEKLPGVNLYDTACALAHFQSPKTLDWIEEHASPSFFMELGRLAALSKLSWKRASEWLRRGQPLSLVALFALKSCWDYNTPLLRTLRPKLLEPESPAIMTKTLQECAIADPLIQGGLPVVISHWNEICGNKERSCC